MPMKMGIHRKPIGCGYLAFMTGVSVQDKNPVTQVLRYAKPGLQGFCPVPIIP